MKIPLLLLFFALLLASSSLAVEWPEGVQKLFAHQEKIALSLTILTAILGGLLTFTSPCGFVILPTFFSSLIFGKKSALLTSAIFSAGMSTAFVIFGIIAGLAGNFFNSYKIFFAEIAGVVLIVFGMMMIFNKGFTLFTFRMKHLPNTSLGVFALGFFFAVGWTPCIGPILGSIVILIAAIGSVTKGAILFGAYSIGIALPLMLISYVSDRYDISRFFTSKEIHFTIFGKKVHTHIYGVIFGIILAAIGSIMLIQKGTTLFMNEIPKYLPWTMEFFSHTNAEIIASSIIASRTADVLGFIIILLFLFIIFKTIKHQQF